jgi:chromosome segregation ATPase
MKEQLENRINELKAELESGQKIMEDLEAQRTNLVYTLLRISGAIQALEELMPKEEEPVNS